MQALLENPQRLFALILTPTRELAYQISEQFDHLGKEIGVKTAVLVGKFYKLVTNKVKLPPLYPHPMRKRAPHANFGKAWSGLACNL